MTLTLLNNRYQVLLLLSNGGFGKTFLAEDTQMPSNKRCVIKQLITVANDVKAYKIIQERFQQEAAILEDLGDRHDLIPRLYAYFSEGNEFYLVQEYIEGQTLTARIQQSGVLNEIEVREILFNILLILEFVHDKGIVHRDIKPDNIILRSSDGKPVLIDFGAVKVTVNTVMSPSINSSRSIVIGTPGFMPIEQSMGSPLFSSDLYSLGLTAIYLLTGKMPQDLPTEPAMGKILWQHFASNINPNFAAVLDKSIQQSPRDRYSTAREMWTALQTLSVSQSVLHLQTASPTVIAAPVAPVYTQVQAQYPNNLPKNYGLGTWQQAVIIGGVIGAFLVMGLWILEIVNKPKEFITTAKNSSQTTSQLSTNTSPIIHVPRQIEEPIQPTTTSSISQEAALQVLEGWFAAKKQIFAPPYDKNLGSRFLTGLVYRQFIAKTDDPEACIARGNSEDNCYSSVDWLQKNQAYWKYGVQKIQRVHNFVANGDQATIVVAVTEERTLYNKFGNIDRSQSGLFTSTTSYNLENENGQIRISNYSGPSHIIEEPIQPRTTSSISQEAALQVLAGWFAAKKQIFAPPYDKNLGARFLTGLIYRKFIAKTDDPEACIARGNSEDNCYSSVDWLRKNQAYWTYGVQKIQRVRNFVANGDQATIVVVVTEERTLYNKFGNIDRSQSGLFTSTTSYNLENENGQIRISNYR